MKAYWGHRELDKIVGELLNHELTHPEREELMFKAVAMVMNDPEETDKISGIFQAGFIFGAEAALHAIESGQLKWFQPPSKS